MKRLLYISLLAIAMLSLATPAHAQEGYPVDRGYPVDEPTDEAIEKQSQGAAEAVADQSVDVPAGGEGPFYGYSIMCYFFAVILIFTHEYTDIKIAKAISLFGSMIFIAIGTAILLAYLNII